MNEMKLTIEQLKNYLGTGLKFYYEGEYDEEIEKPIEFELHGFSGNGEWAEGFGKLKTITDHYHLSELYPVCYRLSDLDKFIPELGFVPLIKMVQECHCGDPNEDWFCGEAIRSRSHRKVYNIGYGDIKWEIELGYPPALRFDYYQKLFQWHFWPFGDEYFESGLVIDKLLYNTTTH